MNGIESVQEDLHWCHHVCTYSTHTHTHRHNFFFFFFILCPFSPLLHLLIVLLFLCLYSDPYSVASLLVQQLLSHFSDTFLTTSSSSTGASKSHDQVLGEVGGAGSQGKLAKGSSLREFLCNEVTILLLVSINIISKEVSPLVQLHFAL